MVSLIGVGDNTIDRYLDMNMMFPGGNAVNVPVFFRRYGGLSSYLGWVGDDKRGKLLLNSLNSENVDVSHCKVVSFPTGHADIELRCGDRFFLGSNPGARKLIRPTGDDYAYLSGHDITHTSIYSYIEPYLNRLNDFSNILSFDYSSDWNKHYLKNTLPYVDIAFLSAQKTDYELEKLMRWIHVFNQALVVVTSGSEGSYAYNGDKILHQDVFKTKIVDTLGAGDSYLARILYETQIGTDLEEAMSLAAESAAKTCNYYGAWEYGVPIEEA